jgi:preprotein translocase subunit SecF
MFKIIQKRKIWYSISGALVLISLVSLIGWGLNFGIDFTGGSSIELSFKGERPDNQTIINALSDLQLASLNVQPIDEKGVLIKTVSLTETQHQDILARLAKITPQTTGQEVNAPISITGEGLNGGVKVVPIMASTITADSSVGFEELSFQSIGPVLGNELKQKTIYAIIIVLIAIILYIAYAFRKVSYPVESWKYGLSAIIALIHDVLIVTGVFVFLGKFLNVQVDAYFVTALLTILGFSVHDTIVTFDRIRENLPRHQDKKFEDVINLSVNETLIRSVNTSLTTFIVMSAVFLFGGESIKYFSFALMIGLIIGTYSSIYLASPLLLFLYRLKKY